MHNFLLNEVQGCQQWNPYEEQTYTLNVRISNVTFSLESLINV